MGFGGQFNRIYYEFLNYTGKSNETCNYGLGYSMVTKLMEHWLNQGYHLLFDKFYTFVNFLNDRICLGTHDCGTSTEQRDGFSKIRNNWKQWVRLEACRNTRCYPEDHCSCVKRVDNKL